MPYIYKIENQINHKLYIGKTLYEIERRWKQHQRNAKLDTHKNMPLYKAIRKYGIENFTISIIEQVDDPDILSEREKYWIAYYDTFKGEGYNATLGGDGALLYDHDKVWDLWQQGKTIKQISKEMNCNDFVVRTVLDNHNISTEERSERSQYKLDASHKPYQREIQQIDIETNKIIATYPSIAAAARVVGCDDSYLSKVSRREGITKGYKWRLTNKDYVKKDFSKRKVAQIDLKTNKIIKTYESLSAAAEAVNGDVSYLSKVCRGIQKTSKGFGWKYVE